jgi:hypothetical protein
MVFQTLYAAIPIESSLMQVACTGSSLQETIRPGHAAAAQGFINIKGNLLRAEKSFNAI